MYTMHPSVIFAIVLFLQLCYCDDRSNTFPCGESASALQTRITHGWEADSTMWPWHAAIFRRGKDTNDYICGATLIGQFFVVTAAHCVVNRATGHKLSPNVFTVHFARQYLNESSDKVQEISVKKVIIHPQFLHVGLKNDIALMSLTTEVQFNEYVLPVCLDKSSQTDSRSDDLVGKEGIIVGWGKTENGEVSMSLQTALLPVVDRIECLNSDPQFFSKLISYGMFCAGYENGTSVCNGDSGSGMYFLEGGKWMLRGIVSFSGLKADRISCDFHKYAGFTNVQFYVPWMRTLVNDSTSTVDVLDASDTGISSRIYSCTYATKNSDCQLSNIHLVNGKTVGFSANNKSPTRVTFQRSYMQFLPKSLIDAFPAMEYVNLQNLRIKNLEPNAFKTARNLLSVNLQMNRLEEISPNAFMGARSLVTLDLSSNRIEFIDEFVCNSIVNIKSLNISRNKITNLPAFDQNDALEILNASYNLVNDVSDNHFMNNKQLHTIDISHNRLTHLDLKQLDVNLNLVTIDISFNILKRLYIPKHVKHLFAENNTIENISTETCIAETLYLAANKLQSFQDVSNCSLLKILDLSNNLLQSFSYRFIDQMRNLESLYLANNRLLEVDIPLKINPVSDLKLLDLSHNLIIHGPPTNAFGKLETLMLSHNELQQFDFSNIKQLQKAYLSNNQWDCNVLQGLRGHLGDRDDNPCSEGFRKVQGICCRDYNQPFVDMLATITRNNFIRDLGTIEIMKGYCLKRTPNRTVDLRSEELLDKLSKLVKEKNDLQADLDATLQVRLNLSETYETIIASLQSLRQNTSAITDVIENQRRLVSNATRDGKSDLKLLQEIFIAMVSAVRSTYNKLQNTREYIQNIPYRIRELNSSIRQLKQQIRMIDHDLTSLKHDEQSMILRYEGLTRIIQNINNNAPTRYNEPTTTYQQNPQGGFYSEQNYRYEYHSSSAG